MMTKKFLKLLFGTNQHFDGAPKCGGPEHVPAWPAPKSGPGNKMNFYH